MPAEATGRLLAHVLRGTIQPFWHCSDLRTVVTRIAPSLVADVLANVRNEALRLGCSDAHSW